MVRIHAGEPLFHFNSLEGNHRIRVQILYRTPISCGSGLRMPLNGSTEHGFENRIQPGNDLAENVGLIVGGICAYLHQVS